MIGIGAITGLILTSVNNVSQTELLARTHESLKVVVYEGEIAKCDDQSVECIKIGSGKSTEK